MIASGAWAKAAGNGLDAALDAPVPMLQVFFIGVFGQLFQRDQQLANVPVGVP
jgi:hypothetical protein